MRVRSVIRASKEESSRTAKFAISATKKMSNYYHYVSSDTIARKLKGSKPEDNEFYEMLRWKGLVRDFVTVLDNKYEDFDTDEFFRLCGYKLPK